MSKKTTRRMVLKAVASLPAALTLGVLPSIAKETHCSDETEQRSGTSGFSTPVAGPTAAITSSGPIAKFSQNAFPDHWSAVSFELTQAGSSLPGILIKLPDGQFVAYRSRCPKLSCRFDLIADPTEIEKRFGSGIEGAILACQCHGSAFDVQHEGKVLSGPDRQPPEKFVVKKCHDRICILSPAPDEVLD